MGALPSSYDPQKTAAGISYTVFYNLYDGLTEVDDQGNLLPKLATAWKQLDAKRLQLTPRQGVKFHNGEPFNAQVVKYNFDRNLDPNFASAVRNRIPNVTQCEVVDDHTVILHSEPIQHAVLLKGLSCVFMVPMKLLQKEGSDKFVQHPVGTGPFKLVDGAPGDFIKLEANTDYFGTVPKIQQVVMTAKPEAATRVASLLAGEVDLVQNLPTDQLQALKGNPDFDVTWAFMQRMMLVLLYEFNGSKTSTQKGPLDNVKVRQALNYAIDKEAIVKDIMQGYARASGQLVGPGGVGYDSTIAPYPYDVAKAKQLLAEAGYPNGIQQPLVLFSPIGAYSMDKSFMEAVANYWTQAGIHIDHRALDWQAYNAMGDQKVPMQLQGMNYFPVNDGDFIMTWWASENQTQPPYTIRNPDYDKYYMASTTELNPTKRAKDLQLANQVAHDNAMFVYLFQPPDIWGVNKTKVQGFKGRTDSRLYLLDVTVTS